MIFETAYRRCLVMLTNDVSSLGVVIRGRLDLGLSLTCGQAWWSYSGQAMLDFNRLSLPIVAFIAHRCVKIGWIFTKIETYIVKYALKISSNLLWSLKHNTCHCYVVGNLQPFLFPGVYMWVHVYVGLWLSCLTCEKLCWCIVNARRAWRLMG